MKEDRHGKHRSLVTIAIPLSLIPTHRQTSSVRMPVEASVGRLEEFPVRTQEVWRMFHIIIWCDSLQQL